MNVVLVNLPANASVQRVGSTVYVRLHAKETYRAESGFPVKQSAKPAISGLLTTHAEGRYNGLRDG